MREVALRWNDGRPEVGEDACAGCEMCVHSCTTDPPSITVTPRTEPADGRLQAAG